MSHKHQHWTKSLRSDASRDATILVTDQDLSAAVAELGEEPTRWALQLSTVIADKVSDHFPDIASGNSAFNAISSAMQSALLGMLASLRRGAVHTDVMSVEGLESVRVSVEQGIELTTMLASMRRAHALTVEAFMQACRSLAPAEELPALFASISEVCFEFVGRLADTVTERYAVQQKQWRDSPRAQQLALLDRLIAGEGLDVDLVHAAAVLRYEIAFRYHVAISVWNDSERVVATDEMEAAATRFLRGYGVEQTLVIGPQPDSTVLAWGNSRTAMSSAVMNAAPDLKDLRIALGSQARDYHGFRDTAREAREARDIVTRVPGLDDMAVAPFRDLSLLGLLSSDTEQAQRFVEAELGGLARDGEHIARILETLEAYLDSHSPQAVSQRLFIARNTVTYRLRKAEELLGRPINERQPELRAATILARVLRPRPPATTQPR
jgi:hypothetical protein